MAVELEAKIKVDSCDSYRERLAGLGANHVYTIIEINRIFDTPDQSLFKKGCGLRIRTCSGTGDVSAASLTFKGPQQAGPFKSREELETHLGDADAAVSILHALGYAAVITFEKRREEWNLDGLSVELDEVPRLGCFVEIEGPDEPSVRRVQQQLGLADKPSISDSYIALLINHARANGLAWDHITFEST